VSPGFTVIIPARYESSRLPGKPLVQIGDKTLIEHVYLSAKRSSANEVIIATDDERIKRSAQLFNAKVVMTSNDHASGTDRLHEVVETLKLDNDEIIVNVQGDEFGMDSVLIDTVAQALYDNRKADIATLCEPINNERDYKDPNTVKLVLDENNFALYFSRAAIPWDSSTISLIEDTTLPLKHIGIYAYHAGFLSKFAKLLRPRLEIVESLEQIRALYHGYNIYVKAVSQKGGVEINTEDDLSKAREFMLSGST
jgi:3-deoxy-manno-octulosonate cytidylyltransferase (CMP-KDO synthetase)